MTWTTLKSAHASYTEAALQAVFDRWDDPDEPWDGCSLAGIPEWLEHLGKPDRRESFKAYGYSYQPDVLWRDPGYVIELKCAAKHEPMALAEALHHAEMLTRANGRLIRPVVISKFNGWIRAALGSLQTRHGVPWDAVRYYEADYLVADKRRFIWLDAPLAPWVRLSSRPTIVPPEFADSMAEWYEIGETRSFVAVPARCDERPLFPVGAMAMVAPVAGAAGSVVCWQGEYPGLGAVYSGREFDGRYLLWEP